jgi:hypothetical protein
MRLPLSGRFGLQVVLERACKAAAERADNDFRQLLLTQQQEGAISARSTWSAVKAQVRERNRAASRSSVSCYAVVLPTPGMSSAQLQHRIVLVSLRCICTDSPDNSLWCPAVLRASAVVE